MDDDNYVKCTVCCKELNLLEVHFSDETLLAFARRLFKEEPKNGVSNFCLCGRCNDSLKNAYFFEQACVSTDNVLKDHLDSNCDKMDLKLLICTLLNVKDSTDLVVCRLCRSFSNSSAVVPLDEIMKESSIMEVFQKHIPEVNLAATQDPYVCHGCQESLINFTNLLFLMSRNRVGEQRVRWMEIKEEVTDFDDIQIDENHFQVQESRIIKQEPVEEVTERSAMVDDDDDDIPQLVQDKDVDHPTATNHILNNLYHECRICGFRTRITELFKEHMSKHHTDSYKYNCSRCPFETNSYASSLSHVRFHSSQWPGRKKTQKQGKFKPRISKATRPNGATSTSQVIKVVIDEEIDCAPETIYYCELCDFKTLSLDELKAHVEVHMKR